MSPDYDQVHALRFRLSLDWLRQHLPAGIARILELGGNTTFTAMVAGEGHVVIPFASDLRKKLAAAHRGAFDAVLCMEVIEHVADTDRLHTEWAGDGVGVMLESAMRALKPGGILFLTTPNAVSITTLKHALHLVPPMIYRPHVREYAPYELDEIIRAAGFIIERRETLDVWRNAISVEEHKWISDFIAERGYPRELRGENIFMLARKPGDPILENPKAEGFEAPFEKVIE